MAHSPWFPPYLLFTPCLNFLYPILLLGVEVLCVLSLQSCCPFAEIARLCPEPWSGRCYLSASSLLRCFAASWYALFSLATLWNALRPYGTCAQVAAILPLNIFLFDYWFISKIVYFIKVSYFLKSLVKLYYFFISVLTSLLQAFEWQVLGRFCFLFF